MTLLGCCYRPPPASIFGLRKRSARNSGHVKATGREFAKGFPVNSLFLSLSKAVICSENRIYEQVWADTPPRNLRTSLKFSLFSREKG